MNRLRAVTAVVLLCWFATLSLAADAPPPLLSARGAVVKANASVLIVRPRGADGKFEKAVTLKIRGTSRVTLVSFQKRDGQVVPVQREGEIKELKPEQVLAVIYTNLGDEYVLLSAVAAPPADK
jgi:hypothetical protein